MRWLLSILDFSLLILNCSSYGRPPVGIAFYDVDRLYDTVPALFYDDSDYTPEGRLRWTAARYERKIRNTAAVIDSMALPIVALWGVENEQVVRDLAAACRGDYSYLHRTLNSLDGMDFALLYYGDLFYPVYDESGRGYLYVEGELGRDTDSATEPCGPKNRAAAMSGAPGNGRCATGSGPTRRCGLPKATFSHAAIWLTKRAVTPSQPTPEGSTGAVTDIPSRCSYTSGRFFWKFRKVFVFSQSLGRK